MMAGEKRRRTFGTQTEQAFFDCLNSGGRGTKRPMVIRGKNDQCYYLGVGIRRSNRERGETWS